MRRGGKQGKAFPCRNTVQPRVVRNEPVIAESRGQVRKDVGNGIAGPARRNRCREIQSGMARDQTQEFTADIAGCP